MKAFANMLFQVRAKVQLGDDLVRGDTPAIGACEVTP